jgi:hypothetical protein
MSMKILKDYAEYYKNNPEGYWFKKKLYGWGWTPVKWQGWVTLLVWSAFFIFGVINLDREWLKSLVFIIIITTILIFICYKKGEKPDWQWGPKDQK